MKDRLYPLFTFLIRKTYLFGLGKIIHFILKNLGLLSNPMSIGENMANSRLVIRQFENLDNNLNHRRKIALIYARLINTKILSSKLTKQISLSTNLRFPIFVEKRDSLIKFLAQNQIFVSDIWYDAVVAPKRNLPQTDYNGQCPNAELVADEIVNLPTHINVREKDAEKISDLVNQWLIQKK